MSDAGHVLQVRLKLGNHDEIANSRARHVIQQSKPKALVENGIAALISALLARVFSGGIGLN